MTTIGRTGTLSIAVLTGALVLAGCGGSPSADQASLEAGASSSASRPATGLTPKGPTETGLPVARVVDGDTIHVLTDEGDLTVRLIGINTPETVKPGSPVECFGPEASSFAKHELTGQTVTLEFDESQGREDQYGRTLAYVWLEQPGGQLRLFNLDAVAGGFAEERQYGPTPYAWKQAFRSAEDTAKAADVGMWGAC